MIGKAVSIWSLICLLLAMAVLVFMAIHPLNCPTNVTSHFDSLLSLFCR
jgi:hypothetical protein